MKHIRSLDAELRMDCALFQYSARRHRIVDYRIRNIRKFVGGEFRVYFQSELEQCPNCASPSMNIALLTEHYLLSEHIAYVFAVPVNDFKKYQNSARHDALRYVLNAYRKKTDRPILSTATVESVLRVIGEEIEHDAHTLITPQLEALVGVLQRNAPEYFQKREHFWAMMLLGSDRT